jgi:uncharacterized protein YeaO (DUF488 family)
VTRPAGLDASRGPAIKVKVRVKRIYDESARGDGYRILIDHVWPRGVSRERARLDDWARELAPSDQLRKMVRPCPRPLSRVSSP